MAQVSPKSIDQVPDDNNSTSKLTGKGHTFKSHKEDKDYEGQDETKSNGIGPTKSDTGKMHGSTKLSTCSSNLCKNGATCQIEGLGYNCLCKPGFVGSTCQYTAEQMKKGYF